MTPDRITTVSGIISGVCALILTVFPGPLGELLKIVIGGIGAITMAIFAYYTNKGSNTPAG
jgi:hypothetical protein